MTQEIFVDRESAQKVFEDAAFAIPADRSAILVFYGVGGQGKTALSRELVRKTDTEVEPAYWFLRRAELDLHGRTKEDPDRLLVWIRNGFADAGIVFPCFDLAFAITWEATRGEEPLPKFTNEAPANLTAPETAPTDGRTAKATGRTHQLATRVRADFYDELKIYAAQHRLKLVEVLEQAFIALKEKNR